METVRLSNGLDLPAIGLGAYGLWGDEKILQSPLAREIYDIYCYAIKSGKCTLFDISAAYGYSQQVLGRAIHDTGKRENVKIITKASNGAQREGRVLAEFEKTLKDLQTDYIDCFLFHWPQAGHFIETYLQMEKLYEQGVVKAIGVANCNIHHLEELSLSANITPMLDQFELHPLNTQDALYNYCIAKDIKVLAYTPIGRMHDVLLKAKPIRSLAKKYGKTPAQIILRWHLQKGHVTTPGTKSREHFDELFSIFDFTLDTREIAWISSVNQNTRLRYDPDNCDFNEL